MALAARATGIHRRVTCHTFRHSFATRRGRSAHPHWLGSVVEEGHAKFNHGEPGIGVAALNG